MKELEQSKEAREQIEEMRRLVSAKDELVAGEEMQKTIIGQIQKWYYVDALDSQIRNCADFLGKLYDNLSRDIKTILQRKYKWW